MIKNKVTLNEVVDFFNELIEIDPNGITELFLHRVVVNDALANHPTVQATDDNNVGLIGILNGLFGIHDNGWGAFVFMTEGDVVTDVKLYDD